jgi:spore coat protein CotH
LLAPDLQVDGSREPGGADASAAASEELYDPQRLPRFDIELPPASVAALGGNPRQYVRGTFRYGNETVTDVGVRLKGESTLRPLTRKAPFKIKFDEYVPDQTFRGLRRMTLNNMLEDPSFMAERLSYYAFRSAGLPAPRANSAIVYLNGSPCGVYANIETEDKTFLRRWFASDAGNLYEEGQVDFLPGNETRFELETNEQRNDRTDLRTLIAAVQSAGDETVLADLERALDTDHFLRFTAVEALVNQWDMYGYTRFYPNNFRLYHDPSRGKFVFIPWGMDMSLKDFRGRGDHIGIYSPARQYNNPNGPITGGLIFQRCLRSATCKNAYTTQLRELLRLFESLALEAVAERYYAQIKDQVYADPRKEVSNAAFERGYATVRRIIRERPTTIRAEIGN